MFDILSLKEPPERVGAPEFPFPSREAYLEWIRRKAISNVWYGAEEAERRLTEKYGPGLFRPEEGQSEEDETILPKEPPERVGAPEFPFPSREAYLEWIRRKAISNVWYGAEEAERRLTEKYGPGLIQPEEEQSADE